MKTIQLSDEQFTTLIDAMNIAEKRLCQIKGDYAEATAFIDRTEQRSAIIDAFHNQLNSIIDLRIDLTTGELDVNSLNQHHATN